MLILSRKIGQDIVINLNGEIVTIKLLGIDSRSTARLGLEADRSVKIDRGERLEKLNGECVVSG